MATLQDAVDKAGSAKALLGGPIPPFFVTPYPPFYTNWINEQRASHETALIFDQSYHMTDLYITGPDRKKLLSDTSVNNYDNFGANKAKQYVAVNENGYLIGDSILFGLSDDEYLIVAGPSCANWLQYQAEIGGYDVSFEREERNMAGPTPKRLYRYNMEGPNVWKILTKAAGQELDLIKFFQMGELPIAGHTVRGLNHTMGGVPGDDLTGLEIFGPEAEGPAVLEAILKAGEEFGLLRGGIDSYSTTVLESGWLGLYVPAVYGEELRPYREWLDENTAERLPARGSFQSDDISDYYATPWDVGYGHIIKYDHDFIGREALEKMAEKPASQKVWFSWNPEDTLRVLGGWANGRGEGPMQPALPAAYGFYDDVQIDGKHVGMALYHGYTWANGGFASVGWVDIENAVDGKEVEILWGDADGGASNPYTAPHKQTKVRATISTRSPVA